MLHTSVQYTGIWPCSIYSRGDGLMVETLYTHTVLEMGAQNV